MSMIIDLKPETEQIVRQELESGHFQTVDDLILQGVNAWREQRQAELSDAERCQAVEQAIDFAKNRAVPLKGLSIRDLRYEGHRV